MNDFLISVIIPTLNRQSFLEKTLNYLSLQEFSSFEIIVIDQSDNSPIYSIPDNLKSRTSIVRVEEKSASKARNLGLLESKGDVVLFLDDDIIVDRKDFIFNHYRHYSNPDINGVAGAILDTRKLFVSKRHRWSFRKNTGWLFFPINFNSACYIESAWAGNFSIRRDLGLEIGGMDENFHKGAFREEADFCYRYSQRFGSFLFDPDASLIHIGASSGGIRAFSVPARVKAQQHYDGQFYFLLKNIPIRDYFYHFVSAYLYFLHNKVKWYDLISLFKEGIKCIKGISNARRMLKSGPRYITIKKQ